MKKNYPTTATLVLMLAICFIACTKNDSNPKQPEPPAGKSHATDILTYTIDGMDAQATVVTTDKQVTVMLPDTLTSGANIVAKFTVSPGASVSVNGTAQVSGSTKNNYENEVDYKVTAEDGVTYTYWRVIASNTNYSLKWGLGHIVQKFVHNDRDYNWYLDQANTGLYSSVNCGPTSVTMAIKWYDSTFTKTPEDARNYSQTTGDLWYPATITNYLGSYNIPFKVINLTDDEDKARQLITGELDKGNILVSCVYTGVIRGAGTGDQRVDKYYDWGAGHCLVIKGYILVDNEYFLQVYDPWDYGAVYSDDGTPKGKDRFYHASDVAFACKLNANSVWSVSPK
jgi:hypothetical protein